MIWGEKRRPLMGSVLESYTSWDVEVTSGSKKKRYKIADLRRNVSNISTYDPIESGIIYQFDLMLERMTHE